MIILLTFTILTSDTNSTYYTTKREREASIYYRDGAIREERQFRKALFPIN